MMVGGSPFESVRNFASTNPGKAAIAGVAIAIALALGAVGYFYIAGERAPAGASGLSQGNKSAGSAAQKVVVKGGESTGTAEPMEPPVAVDSYSQDQFRDPFRPIDESATASVLDALKVKIKDAMAERGRSGYVPNLSTGSGGSGKESLAQGTLKLESISESEGTRMATVVFGGTRYAVGIGDKIDGSSYQVVDIGADNITVLYGDDRLTLTIGESISK